jgi:hypothetical protein
VGPIAAPIAVGAAPTIAAPAAAQLAYYASTHLAVLAPRGWHCFELYGSTGSTLLVTPEPHDATDLLGSNAKVTGPGIQLSRRSGDTSGRFEVAKIAARLFPAAKAFVQQVIDEGLEPAEEFRFGAYPNDVLTRRGVTEVEFLTPGNSEGMGTYSGFTKNSQPISGVAILLPRDGMDLVKLDIRLPPQVRGLTTTITGTVESDKGIPALDKGLPAPGLAQSGPVPMPDYDPIVYCRNLPLQVSACMLREQAAYDELKKLWPKLTELERQRVMDMSDDDRSTFQVQPYSVALAVAQVIMIYQHPPAPPAFRR